MVAKGHTSPFKGMKFSEFCTTGYNPGKRLAAQNRATKGMSFEEIHGKEKSLKMRKNLSIKASDRIVSNETREKIKNTWRKKVENGYIPWNKGLTKETNESVASISKKLTGKMVGEKNPFYGKHHTEKQKQEFRNNNTGRPSPLKDRTVEDIMGEKRGKARREKLKAKRAGKTWEELFKPSTVKKLRKNFAGPFKNYEETVVLKRGTAKKSKVEKRFCKELRKQGINNFTTDKVVCGFVPDILFEPQKIIVEVNGVYYHNMPNMKNRDIRKRKAYSLNGYKLLEITDIEINNDMESCIEKVREAILCQIETEAVLMEMDRIQEEV